MQIPKEYADYKIMPDIQYKIIEYLMTCEDAEILWKLLKYNDADAYKKPNLTREEKASLIYKGQEHQDGYCVFFDYMMDDAIDVQKTMLRLFPAEVFPITRVTGTCNVNFEVYTHSQINHLSNYKTRVDMIIQTLIEVLNGKDIGGLGVLYFDNQASRYDRIQTIGSKPFKGKILIMSVNVG